MSPCSRGCCWSPYGCALSGTCACHWGDWLKVAAPSSGAVITHRDPTANEAIGNITRERRGHQNPRSKQ